MYFSKIARLYNITSIDNISFSHYIDNINRGVWDKFKLEKDFLLTAILTTLSEKYPELIFKGGTCLNKCYFPYFRLSEDLDFIYLTSVGRNERKNILESWKNELIDLMKKFGLSWVDKRTKYNEDYQGLFEFSYYSLLDNSPQTIKIDISLKKALQTLTEPKSIQSLFIDPVFLGTLFPEKSISCMSLDEIIAEKIRAALTRTAIRDYFDLHYIRLQTGRDFSELSYLVRIKLAEVDFAYHHAYEIMRRQVETDLRPVLRDMMGFDFDEIWQFVNSFKMPTN